MNKLFKIFSIVAILALFAGVLMRVGQASAAPKNLPYGLTMQDTMASVEQKLGQPRIAHALQAGWEPGLPDAGGSPDHIHYWAVYKRFGVTIVYNSPLANDKNATIYDVIVDE
jgi:hypothetical protein